MGTDTLRLGGSSGRFVHGRRAARAFTIIDVLVTITVIAVLIGILLPSLSSVNETARRVICQSNLRQIGLGVLMYADDHQGHLPPSVFLSTSAGPQRGLTAPQEMITLRMDPTGDQPAPWDGLGVLFASGYISAPKVFYCPSHHGDNPYSRYARAWSPEGPGEIVCNYHYRGQGPAGHTTSGGAARQTRVLHQIDPSHSSLIADGLRVQSDFNHRVGVNFFRADLTVHWFADPTQQLMSQAAVFKSESTPEPVNSAWDLFDQSVAPALPR